jgi:hypothetical protein
MTQLEEAMRAVGGTTTDPDLRRAAARLADLVRSEDDELERFGRRHLPQQTTDTARLSELRDLLLGLSRLLALLDSPDAGSLLSAMRATLVPRLQELEAAASHDDDEDTDPEFDDPGATARIRLADTPHGKSRRESAPFPITPPSEAPIPSPWAQIDDWDPQVEIDDWDPQTITQAIRIDRKDAPPASILPFSEPPEPRPKTSPQPHDDSALPFSTRHHATPPPGPAPLPPHLAKLDIAAHATFSAMLVVFPDRHAEVYAHFGIHDDAERDLLDHAWQSRFHADETLAARWTELHNRAMAHYRTST